MPRPFSLTLGGDDLPWARGLNTAKRPAEMAPNEAQAARGVDLAAGTLRGAWSPGTAITQTVAANSKFVCCAGGTDWISSPDPDTACRIDYRTVAYTKIAAGAYDYPRSQQGGTNARLGVPAPGSGMTATGGARPNRSYALVYVDAAITYPGSNGFAYSNPSPIVSSGNSGATLNNIPGAALSYTRAIYATVEGDPTGTLFHYSNVPAGATSWTDTGGIYGGYSVDQNSPLNWGVGGHIDSKTTQYDYSAANYLAILAEEMYATGGVETGVMFGVLASFRQNYVAWSHAGKPWAWPTKFQHNMHESGHALVVWQGAAFAFTDTSIWAFRGGADYAITPERISATHPIRPGFGKSAKATPWGILYVSREGLALFDGLSTRIITKGILSPETWLQAATYANAAFYDGAYRLNLWGQSTVLIVEMGDAGVSVTTASIDAADLHVAPIATSNPGLFVAGRAAGSLSPWRPADGAAVSGAVRQTWQWQTAELSLGAASRLKRFDRARVAVALNGGTLNVTISAKDTAGAAVPGVSDFTRTIASAADAEFWLPAGFIGHTASVTLTPSAGTVEVFDLTMEGEVLDAA